MKGKRNPSILATRSIAFPAATLSVGCLILFLTQNCCKSWGLGAIVGLLPFLMITFLLYVCGIMLGLMSGIAALRLMQGASGNDKSKVLWRAWLGITLSLAELWVFYWFVYGGLWGG